MGVHTLADKVRQPCRGADCDMSFIYAFINVVSMKATVNAVCMKEM